MQNLIWERSTRHPSGFYDIVRNVRYCLHISLTSLGSYRIVHGTVEKIATITCFILGRKLSP